MFAGIDEEDIIHIHFIKPQEVVIDEVLDKCAGIDGIFFPGCLLVQQLHIEMDAFHVDIPQVYGVDDVVVLQLCLLLDFLALIEEAERLEGDVCLVRCDFL